MSDPPPNPPRIAEPSPVRLRFTRANRLTKALEFEAVYAARTRKVSGPLAVMGKPNDLPRSRLGLSIGRRAGPATVRSRLKRLVREAFRLEQAAMPRGLDLVVSIRAPGPYDLATFRASLLDAAVEIRDEWERRQRRAARQAPSHKGGDDVQR